jgi:hypothetical protein
VYLRRSICEVELHISAPLGKCLLRSKKIYMPVVLCILLRMTSSTSTASLRLHFPAIYFVDLFIMSSYLSDGLSIDSAGFPRYETSITEGDAITRSAVVLTIEPGYPDYACFVSADGTVNVPCAQARVELILHGGYWDGLAAPSSALFGEDMVSLTETELQNDGSLELTFEWRRLRVLRAGWYRFKVHFYLDPMGVVTDERDLPWWTSVDLREPFYVNSGAWSLFP